jgi:hypothetical protein
MSNEETFGKQTNNESIDIEESNRQQLKAIAETFAKEGKARHEARMCILKCIVEACKQVNSGSVKSLAEAYQALVNELPVPRRFSFPLTRVEQMPPGDF